MLWVRAVDGERVEAPEDSAQGRGYAADAAWQEATTPAAPPAGDPPPPADVDPDDGAEG